MTWVPLPLVKRFSSTIYVLGAYCFITALVLIMRPLTAGEPEEVRRWIAQLENTTQQQRVNAAARLAEFGASARAAIKPLVKCLEDSNADVRLYAALALAKIGQQPELTIPALAGSIRDVDEHVRYSAEWSLARVVRETDWKSFQTVDQLQHFCHVLEQSVSDLTERRRQARNMSAIQAAISAIKERIEQLQSIAQAQVASQAAEAELARQQAEQKRRQQVEQERLASEIDTLHHTFEAANLVERFQMIAGLTDNTSQLTTKRKLILHRAFELEDFRLIDFAFDCWGAQAQKVLDEIFRSCLKAGSESPVPLTVILSMLEPMTAEQLESLLGIAVDQTRSVEVRIAALGALGRGKQVPTTLIQQLVPLVTKVENSELIRTQSMETLQSFGIQAECGRSALEKILVDSTEPTAMITASANALGKIAPSSAVAVNGIIRWMDDLEVNDYFYLELVQALSHFGANASAARPAVVRGLKADDVYFRITTAQTLASTCDPLQPQAESQITQTLVTHILDTQEDISVKVACAKAIKSMGDKAIVLLAEQLSPSRGQARNSLLRSLAVLSPHVAIKVGPIAEILSNEKETTDNRAAAATVLGEMRVGAVQAIQQLQTVVLSPSTDARLLGPAAIALAQVDPKSRKLVAPLASHDDSYVRACAALALHYCGENGICLRILLELLDDAEDTQVLEDTLLELGAAATPSLIAAVSDSSANDQRRLACFRVLVRLSSTDWTPVINALGDPNLGDELADNLQAEWEPHMKILPNLVRELAKAPAGSPKRERIEGLIDSMTGDLGADGDQPQWSGGHALSRLQVESPETATLLLESDAESTALPKRSKPVASHADSEPQASSPGPMPSLAVDEATDAPLPAFSAGETNRSNAGQSENDRLVRVFYGTNRLPLNRALFFLHDWRWPAACGLALATMMFCILVLARQRRLRYAVVALAGLIMVCMIGFQAVRNLKLVQPETGSTVQYGGEFRDQVDLGICDVSIPPGHQAGELEAPALLRLEFSPDEAKHVVLRSTLRLNRDEFYNQMDDEMNRKGKNLLVFVHGYNVSFEDAARRTAQMAFDLEFAGAPVFYSWPSYANWYRYGDDKKNIELSVEHIKEFLLDLATQTQADTINLVAHSMGTVGLTEALREIHAQDQQKLFNQVVLAAPDIDADIFKKRIAPHILEKANRITMYTSGADLALIASRYFNRGPRAGDSGRGITLYPGIETIDASAVDTSLLGHSYYGSNVSVLHDIRRLLANQPIANRQYLRPASDQSVYWTFDPTRVAESNPINLVPVR